MKAGDEKCENGKLYIWVVCPDCGEGRWLWKTSAKRAMFTGRCRACYLKVARQEMGRYYPFDAREG